MNKKEAKEIILKRMAELEALPFGQLLQFQSTSNETVLGPSGQSYQLEVFSFWESKKRRNLRVVVAIDDGGWRTYAPMSVGFGIAQKDDPVRCPIFLVEVEGRDIGIYQTVEEAESGLEPWMIEEQIMVGYDGLGRRLSLDTDGTRTFVSPAELEPSGVDELESALRDYLVYLGENEAANPACDLPCLVSIAGSHAHQRLSAHAVLRNIFTRRKDV